ncbi:hypothetical protein ATCC90586_001665 [Pythium insidiosum]|nr:hypothetical protein ATCC90586_001665 [Pythium insidiosum]
MSGLGCKYLVFFDGAPEETRVLQRALHVPQRQGFQPNRHGTGAVSRHRTPGPGCSDAVIVALAGLHADPAVIWAAAMSYASPRTINNAAEYGIFAGLRCLPTADFDDECVVISIAFQRPPPLVSIFRSNPAMEMVMQLARGLRDLLEDPPELQEISVAPTGPVDGEPIYVPQHLNGHVKMITVTDDGKPAVIRVPQSGGSNASGSSQWSDGNVSVWHSADTAPGSSGSPVLSLRENTVVALHHAGTTSPKLDEGELNIAIRSDAIVADLRAKRALPACAARAQRRRRPHKIPHYILFDDGQKIEEDAMPGGVSPPAFDDDDGNITETTGGFAWTLNSISERTLTRVSVDPSDPLASMRGSGSIAISTSGVLSMKGSPRYYVTSPTPVAGGIEMIAYARLTDPKATFNDITGVTIVTRSNHAQSDKDPCQDYSRIYFSTGEFAFQKELDGKFPLNRWIGVKFLVLPNAANKSVTLRCFVVRSERGDWQQVFETEDRGGWAATQPLPTASPHAADEVIVRAGRDSFFRTDDVDALEWKELSASIAGAPGRAEQSVDAILQATKAAVAGIEPAALTRVPAVGFCGQQSSLPATGYGLVTFAFTREGAAETLAGYDACGTTHDLVAFVLCGRLRTTDATVDTTNAFSWGAFDLTTELDIGDGGVLYEVVNIGTSAQLAMQLEPQEMPALDTTAQQSFEFRPYLSEGRVLGVAAALSSGNMVAWLVDRCVEWMQELGVAVALCAI